MSTFRKPALSGVPHTPAPTPAAPGPIPVHTPQAPPSRVPVFPIVIGTMVALLGLVLYLGLRSGAVSGDIFVTMKSGDVKRGAGVQVFLVPATPTFETERRGLAAAYAKGLDSLKLLIAMETYDGSVGMTTRARYTELHGPRVDELCRAHQAQSVRTDASGHYQVKGLARGRYVVCARLSVFDERLIWLVPVEVSNGSQTLDLSNHNEGLRAEP